MITFLRMRLLVDAHKARTAASDDWADELARTETSRHYVRGAR